MNSPRKARSVVLDSLVIATIIVLVLTAWLLGERAAPVIRERTFNRALTGSRWPAFWWPTSWREEYDRRYWLTLANRADETTESSSPAVRRRLGQSGFPGAQTVDTLRNKS